MSGGVLAGGFAFLGVALAVAAVGRYLQGRGPDRRRVVARLRDTWDEEPAAPADRPGVASRAWAAVARLGGLVLGAERGVWEAVRGRLALAGYTQPSALAYYVGLTLILVAAFAVGGGLAAGVGTGGGWQRVVLWATAGGAVGYLLPSHVLSARVRNRQRDIRNAMPDALDVMVMCLEGGVSLNAAVNWVAAEIRAAHPVLGAEMAVLQREIQLGLTVGEAFLSFAGRCGVAEVRDLAAVLVQSERTGASVGRALRSYADAARQERQLWAEEVAQKAAVKIVFPTMLCIFPAMFIVLLGPAAFQMSKMFAR